MTGKTVKAFSPAGITSFFEVCDTTPDNRPIKDLRKLGARGGGFAVEKGVLTEVSVSEAEINSTQVFINGAFAPEAETTKTAVDMVLKRTNAKFRVTVKHDIEVPVGAGFGTSAGGPLGAVLVLSQLLRVNLTVMQAAQIVHVAEVKCQTGLGTAGPLTVGGCVLTVKPGALGYSLIDRIPLPPGYLIVAGVFQPWPTKTVLKSREKRSLINKCGYQTLERILSDPSPENFMDASRDFAYETGFATDRVKQLITAAKNAGAVGAAQNMLGEAVHALVEKSNLDSVLQAFKRVLPREKIIVGAVDFQGARLLG